MTAPPLEKESSGSARVYEILQQNILSDLLFHCFSEGSSFETSSMVENVFINFLFNFVPLMLSHFLITKNP